MNERCEKAALSTVEQYAIMKHEKRFHVVLVLNDMGDEAKRKRRFNKKRKEAPVLYRNVE